MRQQLSVHLISGAPRSGTTLLQAVLSHSVGSNPLIGEARFIRHFLEFYKEVNRIWDDDAKYCFGSREQAAEIARAGIMAIVDNVAARYDATSVVIKSPEFGRYPSEVRAVLKDNAHCYIMLRDPKDIVALQWLASKREHELGFVPSMFTDLASGSRRRLLGFGSQPTDGQIGFLALRLLDYYPDETVSAWNCVSYENLVSDPLAVLRALNATSGLTIAFDPAVAWSDVEFDYLRSSSTLERAWSSDLWGQPITTSRIGIYRKVLSRRQAAIIEDTCGSCIADWQSITNGIVHRGGPI
jgi:Sulfotransferase family